MTTLAQDIARGLRHGFEKAGCKCEDPHYSDAGITLRVAFDEAVVDITISPVTQVTTVT